jgi:hypothetical protein
MDLETKITIITLGVLIGILFVLRAINECGWNDGYCSCGGRWVYQQAVGHRYETTYIYKCDKCGDIEEFFDKHAEVNK